MTNNPSSPTQDDFWKEFCEQPFFQQELDEDLFPYHAILTMKQLAERVRELEKGTITS